MEKEKGASRDSSGKFKFAKPQQAHTSIIEILDDDEDEGTVPFVQILKYVNLFNKKLMIF